MNPHPKFAIVRLRPGDDVFTLFRLLVQHGYPEVSFVNGLREDAFLPAVPKEEGQSPGNTLSLPFDNQQNGMKRGPNENGKGSRSPVPPGVPFSAHLGMPSMGPLHSSIAASDNVGRLLSSGVFNPLTAADLTGLMATGMGQTSPSGTINGMPYNPSNAIAASNAGSSKTSATAPTRQSARLASSERQPDQSKVVDDGSENNSDDSPSHTPSGQLRQRGSRALNEDPSVYAACRLCQNKIMASRLSNLTNHVRRHASMKQFQCCYCEYTHNEMAKVRLHMLHNHKDKDSQPIDNLSPEMQAQWDYLMEQCFPAYTKEFFNREGGASHQPSGERPPREGNSTARISQVTIPSLTPSLLELQRQLHSNKSGGGVSDDVKMEMADEPDSFTCIECGDIVAKDQLETHLRLLHAADCVPYACDECGYENSDQWKVRLHISIKHAERAADIAVNPKTVATDFAAFVGKFFPDASIDDDRTTEEENLFKNMKDELSLASEINRATGIVVETEDRSPSSGGQVANRGEEIIGVENLRCELCRKPMGAFRPVSSLLNHAKRHYHVKQYQCPKCSYTSSEAAHVRSHMKLKHKAVGGTPLDNKTQTLQAAWMQVMHRCFPQMSHRFGKFKFKNLKGSAHNDNTNDASKNRNNNAHNANEENNDCEEDGSQQNGDILKCRLCMKDVDKGDYLTHASSHVPMKPYGCSVCHYRSSDYQQLRVHLLKHKSNSCDKARPVTRHQDTGALKAQYVKYCFGVVE